MTAPMRAPSVVTPLRPRRPGWKRVQISGVATLGYPGEAWVCPTRFISVISAVEVAKDKDGVDRGPEYHLSISHPHGRVSSALAKHVLAEFGMEGAEEDNHVPHGIVRNFWRPVAEHLVGIECACKEEEMPQREDKGDYIWRPA